MDPKEKTAQEQHDIITGYVKGVVSSSLLDAEAVKKAINCEDELDGEMPADLFEQLKNNKTLMAEAMRETVRLTKKNIKERLGI